MERYQFKFTPLGDGHVELYIVLPSPQTEAQDLVGPEARKRIAKWVLASAAGLAATCQINLHEILHGVFTRLVQAVDYEQGRDLVIARVRDEPCPPRELEEHPPGGLTPTAARTIAQMLLDEGVFILNDHLKLELYSH